MVFIEAGLFTRLRVQYLGDEDYRGLQNYLMARPDAGAVIRGGAGYAKYDGLPAARASRAVCA